MNHVEMHAGEPPAAVSRVVHALFFACVGIALAAGLAFITALCTSTAAGAQVGDGASIPVPGSPTDAAAPSDAQVPEVVPKEVAETVARSVGVAQDTVPTVGEPVASAAEPVTRTVEDIAVAVVTDVVRTAQPAVRVIDGTASAVTEAVTSATEPVTGTVDTIAAPASDTVAPAIDAIAPIIDSVEPVIDSVTPVIDTVTRITDTVTSVVEGASPITRTVDDAATSAVHGNAVPHDVATNQEREARAENPVVTAVAGASSEGPAEPSAAEVAFDDAQTGLQHAAAGAPLLDDAGQVAFVSLAGLRGAAVRGALVVPPAEQLEPVGPGTPTRLLLTPVPGAVAPATPTTGSGAGHPAAAFLRYASATDADGLRTRIVVFDAAWSSVCFVPLSLPG